jgi:hypothetical protein
MCPIAILSTTNPTKADLPLSLRVEKLASDRLSRLPLTLVSVCDIDTCMCVSGKDITVG